MIKHYKKQHNEILIDFTTILLWLLIISNQAMI